MVDENANVQGESFLNIPDFGEATELIAVPEGEYELQLMEIATKDSQKTGGQYIMARLQIVSEPYSKDISHVMMLPTAMDDPKKRNNRLLAIKHFFEAFGIPYSPNLNSSDYIGCTAWAILRLEENDNDEFGPQNRVRRWISK